MSVRKHGNRWQVRLRVGSGQRIEKTLPPGSTRADALAVEAKARRDAIDHAVGRKPRRTIDELIDRWVETDAKHLKSYARSTKYLVAVLREYTTGKYLDELPDVAETVKATGVKAGMTAPTINRHLAVLRRWGNLAERWGWTDAPLGRRVQLLPENCTREGQLTQAQVKALAAAADPLTRDMIWFAALTGLRRAEMLALTPAQVLGDVIVVNRGGRSGKPRGIPMPPRAARIAARRIPFGLSASALRDRWEAAREAAGLPHVRWHDLRHTYGSWLAQAGQPMTAIRDLMGHSSLTVTSRYSHLAPHHLRQAVKSLPR